MPSPAAIQGKAMPMRARIQIGALGSPERAETTAVLYHRAEHAASSGLGLKVRVPAEGLLATGPSLRAAALGRAKAAAESLRLFYVAFTRARDLLLLAGEAARSRPSWRRLVDEAIASVCKAGQTPNRSNVLAAIKKTDEPTSILGQPISFDSNGDLVNGKFFLFKIQSTGKYQLIPS